MTPKELGDHRREVAENYALKWGFQVAELVRKKKYLESDIKELEAEPEGSIQYEVEIHNLYRAVNSVEDAIACLRLVIENIKS